MRRYLANMLWKLASGPQARRFGRAMRNPRLAQETILFDFLRRNADSQYGQEHGYADIDSVEKFQDRVPLARYEDFEPWIERIRHGQQGVLTTEPVLLFEKTSGSDGPAKYIPYTRSLRREFQRAIGAWLFDLFTSRPNLLGGSHYWSISPIAQQKEVAPGGLPVGMEDDAEYLGPLERWIVGSVMAVPPSVARIGDVERCRRATLDYLLRRRDLRLISVWHPSFLTLLLEQLPAGVRPRDCWPQLQLISCWTSAAARAFVPQLEALFPSVEIQGKGLLATEGVVSIPLCGQPAPVPAVGSHFLEFLDAAGHAHLVDELTLGQTYEVVVTTGGGLARYRLGDLVEVVAPGCIEFIGRGGQVSDVCGEKLSESFVGRILDELAGVHGARGFLMLVPQWGRPPQYVLLGEDVAVDKIAAELEQRLRTSMHYDYCRRLGQLDSVCGVRVPDASSRYIDHCRRLGQRVGDIKPTRLRSDFGWRERMEGRHAAK